MQEKFDKATIYYQNLKSYLEVKNKLDYFQSLGSIS